MSSNRTLFPDEILCHIFCFLSVRDLIRLRSVSKQLQSITYEPAVWIALYKNATFTRPPGPFPFQSTQFLECTLIRSARLAESWTTQPFGMSQRHIPLESASSSSSCPEIIGGRWVLDCISERQFVLRDIDAEVDDRLVIWEDASEGSIPPGSWKTCNITTSEGEMVYVLVRQETIRNSSGSDSSEVSWKLLMFAVNSDSGHPGPCVSLDVPTIVKVPASTTTHSHGGLSGNGAFLSVSIPSDHFIFDTRRRMFYKLPERRTERAEFQNFPVKNGTIVFTNTHVIVLFVVQMSPVNWERVTVVQAFSVPDDLPDHEHGVLTLDLTHEGFTQDQYPSEEGPLSLLRNSIIDLVTGSTNIKILYLYEPPRSDHIYFRCIDLTLAKPPDDSTLILPMSINVHDVFVYDRPRRSVPISKHLFDASDDGYGRGFWAWTVGDYNYETPRLDVMKFTIDGSRSRLEERCGVVLGEPSTAPIEYYSDDNPLALMEFDGGRGWLAYYGKSGGRDVCTILELS